MAKGDYIIKQKYAVVNDAIQDALGNNASISTLNTTDLVSLGKSLANMNLLEGWYAAMANRIVKTVYFVRVYGQRQRSVLRDEHEYGAFVQKVYYKAPDFVANPEYGIPQAPVSPATEYTYKQSSPYDVEAVVEVSASVFGGQGTLALEFVRPVDQIRTAFLSEAEMIRFIDGLYVAADQRIKLAEEELTDLAVNTAIAYDVDNNKVRNLLTEFNALLPEDADPLTAAQAVRDADFLRYACMEIGQTIDYMGEMSTIFNVEGYETFTDRENMVVEVLSYFARSMEVFLQADTFHDSLVSLPRYESVPRWQRLKNSVAQDFASLSAIKIQNSAINSGNALTVNGVVAFVHDIEHVAAYFGHRRTWEKYNERDDVYIHGDTMRKGYAVDGHANGVVFIVADTE
jgi:hypothetical protein